MPCGSREARDVKEYRVQRAEYRVQMKDENEVSTVIQTAQPPIGGCVRYIYAKGLFVAVLLYLNLYSINSTKESILKGITGLGREEFAVAG